MIGQAEWITGLRFTDEERRLMLEDVNETLAQWDELRGVTIDNSVPPAVRFDPAPHRAPPTGGQAVWIPLAETKGPGTEEDVAFASVSELATWLHNGDLSSVHPQIVMPNGFRADGTPTSIT